MSQVPVVPGGGPGGGPPGAVQQVAGAQGGGPPDDPWMANTTTTTPTTPTPNTNRPGCSGRRPLPSEPALTHPRPSPRPNVRSGRPNIDASGAWTPSQKPGVPDRPSQPVPGPSGEGLGALHKP
ncbi:hypothetical protein Bbelb_387790 [Branchiostoma belcheri]|nr:hypothetical protein Bbelb_387790 [Branchiostoma belcheri]